LCFHSIISTTPHVNSFVRSHPRAPGTETRCAFSFPWIRVAWILTLKHRKPDLSLLYAISDIAVTEPPCPGSSSAFRHWHSLIDPSTGTPVSNFDVCPSCVKSLEAMLPPLRGIFVPRSKSRGSLTERVCDLRFDSRRFLPYVDALEVIADRASRTHSSPDIRSFVQLARMRASLRECPGPNALPDQPWHIIPNVPGFTVCEECYHDVILPSLERGDPLAGRVSKRSVYIGSDEDEIACCLWSKNMRDVWKEACSRNDGEAWLRRVIRERKDRLVDLERDRKKLLFQAQRGVGKEAAEGLERNEIERRRWE